MKSRVICLSLLFVLVGVGSLRAQPYGLDTRPAMGAYLNGALPSSPTNSFPALLSLTGAFTDLANMTPAPGLIPYDVNTALWTDYSLKERWIALPTNSWIGYTEKDPWFFPPGTVLVKHFALNVDHADSNAIRRVETRFLVVAPNGFVHGATYRWRTNNTDADLLSDELLEPITVHTSIGSRVQQWAYPSPEQCLECHNRKAGYLLGPKTAQLNRDYTYPQTGVTDNQLRTWNHLGMFESPIQEQLIPTLPRMTSLYDTNAPLEARVRSYLDANCSHCHQPGGTALLAQFDARHHTRMNKTKFFTPPVKDDFDIPDALIVAPGYTNRSIMLEVLTRTGEDLMPPLGRSEFDPTFRQTLSDWIQDLARARLEMLRTGGPGSPVLLRVNGRDDQQYLIESSTNLVDWVPRWTNAPFDGVLEIVEPENAPAKFYRARLHP